MAGLPEKMIEYVLETRIDAAQIEDNSVDTFLEDLVLTHIIYIPTNVLCNYLKGYYMTRGDMVKILISFRISSLSFEDTLSNPSQTVHFADTEFNLQERLTAKRRVTSFLSIWQHFLGIHFFMDPVANSFIEVNDILP